MTFPHMDELSKQLYYSLSKRQRKIFNKIAETYFKSKPTLSRDLYGVLIKACNVPFNQIPTKINHLEEFIPSTFKDAFKTVYMNFCKEVFRVRLELGT